MESVSRLGVAAIALALPTLLARFPPMTDLPLHAAVIGMMRHFNDPAYFPPRLYELNLGHPNQLFHLLAFSLSWIVSVDLACKLVVAGSQIGIILGGARLARHIGVSPWAALLLAPLAIGWSFFWGLVANLLGFAALLFALPTLDRATARPSPRGFLTCALWMVLLYMAHESVMVIACGAILVFTFGYSFSWRRTAARLAPIAVAITVFATQLMVQKKKLGDRQGAFEFHALSANIKSIPTTLTGSLDWGQKRRFFLWR